MMTHLSLSRLDLNPTIPFLAIVVQCERCFLLPSWVRTRACSVGLLSNKSPNESTHTSAAPSRESPPTDAQKPQPIVSVHNSPENFTMPQLSVRSDARLNDRWILHLTVCSALDLQPIDDGGACDPYVVLRVGDHEEHRTACKFKTLMPTWDEMFSVEIMTEQFDEAIMLEVWDQISDSFMGQVHLDCMRRIVKQHGKTQELGKTPDKSVIRQALLPQSSPLQQGQASQDSLPTLGDLLYVVKATDAADAADAAVDNVGQNRSIIPPRSPGMLPSMLSIGTKKQHGDVNGLQMQSLGPSATDQVRQAFAFAVEAFGCLVEDYDHEHNPIIVLSRPGSSKGTSPETLEAFGLTLPNDTRHHTTLTVEQFLV